MFVTSNFLATGKDGAPQKDGYKWSEMGATQTQKMAENTSGFHQNLFHPLPSGRFHQNPLLKKRRFLGILDDVRSVLPGTGGVTPGTSGCFAKGAPPCPKETAPGCTYNPHAPQKGGLYLIFLVKVDVNNFCGEIYDVYCKMSKKIYLWCHCQCTWSFQTQLKQVCQFGSFPKYKKNALKLTAKAPGK